MRTRPRVFCWPKSCAPNTRNGTNIRSGGRYREECLEQIELFRLVTDLLARLQIPYVVVGSFASGVYGEPRMTRDIDIVIDPNSRQVEQLVRSFPPEEFYVSHEAALAALSQRGQFNVIHPESGNKIDFIMVPDDEWGRQQLSRRRRFGSPGEPEWYAASPEDVIIAKMIYFREGESEKHLRDIASMLRVSGQTIDRNDVGTWAARLGLAEIWQKVLSSE